jgi:1-deoxy-D-xylulose-5-phosphate synthase
MTDDLSDIPTSAQIKELSIAQLTELAARIRKRLIQVTSVNGGHLASSLGAVELILALHRVYDFPVDRLVFDVGHQAYTHKLITEREQDFDTLRTYGGLSGFIRREESPFDTHDSGHASDSLSIALGLALSRDLNQGSERIAVLIGDAALSGGLAFEALNQIGQLKTDMTIVLNDNEMSISRNVGALSLHLGRARMSKTYITIRDKVEDRMSNTGRVGKFLVNAGETAKGSFKKLMVPGTFFEDMGIVYIGPIDGHNIEATSEALRVSMKSEGPVLVHTVTQKGRGYAPAEMQPEVFHGVSCYDPATGKPNGKASRTPTFTAVFSQALLAEAKANDSIVAITAAMTAGSGLAPFEQAFPDRFFDVGIAEEHAVALAAGFTLGGKLPVVAIYSSFLQRAFDQIMINVALQDQHVVFCVDRAGIVGEDGSTHHGLFDLAYLRMVPGMRILAPADQGQMRDALHTALALNDGPVALRYPRGEVPLETFVSDPKDEIKPQILPLGMGMKLRDGTDVSLLAVGRMVEHAQEAARILEKQGVEASVYNMLWVKPLDEELVARAAQTPLIVTLEEGTVTGGFASAVQESLAKLPRSATHPDLKVINIGIPDQFLKHGSIDALFEELGLNGRRIAERIGDALQEEGQAD